MQEYTLWKNIREQDDREAFDRLYLSSWEKLYSLALSRTQDQDLAKDLVQEVFVSIWEKRKQIQLTESISQYLAGAMKYRLIDYFQSEKAKRTVFEKAYRVMETVVDRQPFDLSYEAVEQVLEDELEKMPHNMRESLILRMDHFHVHEIANRLNLADQTVSNLLTEATKRLKKNLPKRFESHHNLFVVGVMQLLHDLLTKS